LERCVTYFFGVDVDRGLGACIKYLYIEDPCAEIIGIRSDGSCYWIVTDVSVGFLLLGLEISDYDIFTRIKADIGR